MSNDAYALQMSRVEQCTPLKSSPFRFEGYEWQSRLILLLPRYRPSASGKPHDQNYAPSESTWLHSVH